MTMLAGQFTKFYLVQVDEVCGDILRGRTNEIYLGTMDISYELFNVQVIPVCECVCECCVCYEED